MTERILVPLDESDPAWEALLEALERFNTDDIVALHVPDTSESSHGVQGGAADGWYEAKRDQAEELLREAQAMADEHGVSLATAIESGRPADVIVEYASEHGIDHIVMGSHGRSGISRVLVGSVAETVIRNAPMSVTIARRTDTGDAGPESSE